MTRSDRILFLPRRPVLWALLGMAALALIVLLLGVPAAPVLYASMAIALLLAAAMSMDFLQTRRQWRASSPSVRRRIADAFAIGVPSQVQLQFEHAGEQDWACTVFDHADPTLQTEGLPAPLTLGREQRSMLSYRITPSQRGLVQFDGCALRVRSLWQLLELQVHLPLAESRRVYPDFAQLTRYAWLAGDRRLAELGIKNFRQRGQGTDFKQLREYRYGDPVRQLDWKATLRQTQPVIREFQDERDQCVMFLIDCGRRMRSADGVAHFDAVLNAVMLLSYVALQQGDAVGAQTFATPVASAVHFAPRKGMPTLNALMNALFAVQPTPTHSDYLAAARELMRRHTKRSLIVWVTNFRDEDGSELQQALRLLRSRHLVLLASLRESVVEQMAAQPQANETATLEIAGAKLYEQDRADAFRKLAARDALMIDVEPPRLASELVNHYNAVKRAGLL